MRLAAPALQAALLSVAGWNDLLSRRIPDPVCIALAAVGVAARGAAGIEALAWSGALAALVFTVMVPTHAMGALGGGDIKLSAAFALGLSPAGLYGFLVMTALAGGILAMLHLALRRLPRPPHCPAGAWLPRRVWTAERWRARQPASLPYGIAIAAGGIAALAASVHGAVAAAGAG